MFDDTEAHKTVKFSSLGSYINEFSDVIYQYDTLFNGNDTIALNSVSRFTANGIFPLSDGTSAVISAWAPNYMNKLTDTTIVQLSIYDNIGQFVDDRYIFINATVGVKNVFVSSTDDIIFILETPGANSETYIYITDIQGNPVGLSDPLDIFEVYSFFENNKGEYLFSASSFNGSADLIGLLFSMNRQGQGLWFKQYLNKSAWIFTSMIEMNDGYLFTGFNINKVLLEIDWRTTFDAENVKAVLLKTDFLGAEVLQNMLQNTESTVGASVLVGENITFFGGKYDRTIHSTLILKLNQDLKIIN